MKQLNNNTERDVAWSVKIAWLLGFKMKNGVWYEGTVIWYPILGGLQVITHYYHLHSQSKQPLSLNDSVNFTMEELLIWKTIIENCNNETQPNRRRDAKEANKTCPKPALRL